MRRFSILVISLTAAALLVTGCSGSSEQETLNTESVDTSVVVSDETVQETDAAEITPESSQEVSDGMTDSYRDGRQAYFDACGIWMPEASGFEAECMAEGQSVCFDSHGDRDLYDGAVAAITEVFGDPTNSGDDYVEWRIEQAGIVECYDVHYDESDPDDPWVYMNYHTEQ